MWRCCCVPAAAIHGGRSFAMLLRWLHAADLRLLARQALVLVVCRRLRAIWLLSRISLLQLLLLLLLHQLLLLLLLQLLRPLSCKVPEAGQQLGQALVHGICQGHASLVKSWGQHLHGQFHHQQQCQCIALVILPPAVVNSTWYSTTSSWCQ